MQTLEFCSCHWIQKQNLEIRAQNWIANSREHHFSRKPTPQHDSECIGRYHYSPFSDWSTTNSKTMQYKKVCTIVFLIQVLVSILLASGFREISYDLLDWISSLHFRIQFYSISSLIIWTRKGSMKFPETLQATWKIKQILWTLTDYSFRLIREPVSHFDRYCFRFCAHSASGIPHSNPPRHEERRSRILTQFQVVHAAQPFELDKVQVQLDVLDFGHYINLWR